jgi:hypothetical protein
MKESLYKIMGDEFKGVQYTLFTKTIKYKWSKDDNKWNYTSSNSSGHDGKLAKNDSENWRDSLWENFHSFWQKKAT